MSERSRRVRRRQLNRLAGTPEYWEYRYLTGGNSGEGSLGEAAERKAKFVNDLVKVEKISSVIDWGCGDGNQLALLEIEGYLGVEVSPTAIRECIDKFGDRHAFLLWQPHLAQLGAPLCDLALSMDVIFHLTTEDGFLDYWERLFDSSSRLVLVHATNYDSPANGHVRHWKHTTRAPSDWTLEYSDSDPHEPGFYLYRRDACSTAPPA